MWARATEAALGIWLLASPFVFGHPLSEGALWLTDLLSGAFLLVSTYLNYRYPSRKYFLVVPVLGAALIVSAFLSGPHPVPPALQNRIMIGFTLMMVGIVPNQALRPPREWSERLGDGAKNG